MQFITGTVQSKTDASGGMSSTYSTSAMAFRYPRRDNKGITLLISKRAIEFDRTRFLSENKIKRSLI